MALKVKKGDIPENAVILTKTEAIKYQWEQIMKWSPKSDIWPYTHGVNLLGGIAAVSGMIMNLKFRKALNFKKIGGAVALVTTAVSPGVLTSILQMKFVAEKTMLPIENCPLCIEMRSIAIQNATAILYPLILVPITNFMIALRTQTHRIPYYKKPKELLFFCGQLYKPMLPFLALAGIVNSVAASFILYKQYNCISYMNEVLSIENEPSESTNESEDLL